jgi:hypothetical protein
MFYSPESEPLGSLFLNSKFVCFTSFFLAQAKPLESHHRKIGSQRPQLQ